MKILTHSLFLFLRKQSCNTKDHTKDREYLCGLIQNSAGTVIQAFDVPRITLNLNQVQQQPVVARRLARRLLVDEVDARPLELSPIQLVGQRRILIMINDSPNRRPVEVARRIDRDEIIDQFNRGGIIDPADIDSEGDDPVVNMPNENQDLENNQQGLDVPGINMPYD